VVCVLVFSALFAGAMSCTSGRDEGPPATGSSSAPARARVVVTTDILGDIARNILGDEVHVDVLVPNGVPPRTFKPAAADLDTIKRAQLIVAVGLGLEPGLQDAFVDARANGIPVLEVGTFLNAIPLGGSEVRARATSSIPPGSTATGGTTGGTGVQSTSPEALDPHVWLDPDRVKQAMKQIADAVTVLPSVDAAAIRRTTEAYTARIDKADEEIQSTLAPITDERRRVATVHDNLTYFADRYGFSIATVIAPAGTDTQDTPIDDADIAAASGAIADQQVAAIVTDASATSVLDAERVAAGAADRGASPVVVTLHLEALGVAGSGADTYLSLLTTNAHALADALG